MHFMGWCGCTLSMWCAGQWVVRVALKHLHPSAQCVMLCCIHYSVDAGHNTGVDVVNWED